MDLGQAQVLILFATDIEIFRRHPPTPACRPRPCSWSQICNCNGYLQSHL